MFFLAAILNEVDNEHLRLKCLRRDTRALQLNKEKTVAVTRTIVNSLGRSLNSNKIL